MHAQARLGAVTSIHAFLISCPELVTGDAHRLVVRCLGTAVCVILSRALVLSVIQIDMLAQIPTGAKAASYVDVKHLLHTRIYQAYGLV